jgi:hypothetical protein
MVIVITCNFYCLQQHFACFHGFISSGYKLSVFGSSVVFAFLFLYHPPLA